MATSATMRPQQQDQQQQSFQNSAAHTGRPQWQDKRLQELRAFALEYVKQIVAKASELSQEQKLTSRQNGASERVGQAAEQIKVQFGQLQFDYSSKQQQNKSAFSQQSAQAADRPSLPSRPPPVSTSRLANTNQTNEIAYCEQDFYAIDEQPISCRDQLSQAQVNQHAGAHPAASAKRKGGLYNRLNWQVFISCFSNCLPHNIADSIPSSLTRRPPDGTGGTAV